MVDQLIRWSLQYRLLVVVSALAFLIWGCLLYTSDAADE